MFDLTLADWLRAVEWFIISLLIVCSVIIGFFFAVALWYWTTFGELDQTARAYVGMGILSVPTSALAAILYVITRRMRIKAEAAEGD
jgi:hypothetical protein